MEHLSPTDIAFGQAFEGAFASARLMAMMIALPGAGIIIIALTAIILSKLGVKLYSADGMRYSRVGHLLLKVAPATLFGCLGLVVLLNLSIASSLIVPLGILLFASSLILKAFAPR